MILASNRILAEQNLMLQPRLDQQKNELTKRYHCLQEQFEAFQLRKSALGNVKLTKRTRFLFLTLVSLFIRSLVHCVKVSLSVAYSCHSSLVFPSRVSVCLFSKI